MGTHIGIYGDVRYEGLRRDGDWWAISWTIPVVDSHGESINSETMVWKCTNLWELADNVGQLFEDVNHARRMEAMANHPSMFERDECGGGDQPDGKLPPGARWLSPAGVEAVESINDALMRQREEQDRILDGMDAEFGGDAA